MTEQNSSCLQSQCATIVLVTMNFAVSTMLYVLTKTIYVEHDYTYPLFLTGTHMFCSWLLCSFCIFVLNLVPERRIISVREQVVMVAPFSMLGAMSIACANTALIFLYPSLHEMLQNCSPVFTMVVCMLFGGKRYNNWSYIAMIPVCGGAMMCVHGEKSPDFQYVGVFISCMTSVLRACRALLQQKLLRGQDPIDPLTLLFYAAPFNLCLFLVASFSIEGRKPWEEFTTKLTARGHVQIVAAACCAAFFNLLAFVMIGRLGAVLTMVVGNLKTPTIIVVSIMVFANPWTWFQVAGFVVVMLGVHIYNTWGEELSTSSPRGISNNEEVDKVTKASEMAVGGGNATVIREATLHSDEGGEMIGMKVKTKMGKKQYHALRKESESPPKKILEGSQDHVPLSESEASK